MGKTGPLLLICALAAGGLLNYQRNAPIERELSQRVYADLGTSDLETLIQAYSKDVEQAQHWVGDAPAQPTTNGAARGDLTGNWKSFERFQKESQAFDSRRSQVLDKELILAKLRQEQAIRERGLDRRWRLILYRITTL